MTSNTPLSLLGQVEHLCELAGAEIMKVFRQTMNVQEKSDRSPVTEADLAAHSVLTQGLTRLLDVPVLSEEGTAPSMERRLGWSRYWLIDPLDGTRQFIRGSRDFSVNVALIQNHKPELGYVHLPAHHIAYRAAEGAGSERKDVGKDWHTIATSAPASPLRISVSTERAGPRQQRLLQQLEPVTVALKGSSWKSCSVAEGSADLYPRFGPTCEWDTAAAQCIVEQAGGMLTDIYLKPLRYNQRQTLINPDFFVFGDPELATTLQPVLAEMA
ncbi:MAG: 3'(2'),5'-bisphosphate nucleotidase CysQ [Lysobacterales bacterium]